jgi:uncharacterized membrane protein
MRDSIEKIILSIVGILVALFTIKDLRKADKHENENKDSDET